MNLEEFEICKIQQKFTQFFIQQPHQQILVELKIEPEWPEDRYQNIALAPQ